jgi:hypothetical protein
MQHDDDPSSTDAPAIQTRADGKTGWSTALPLLLVGLLALMLLQTCVAG